MAAFINGSSFGIFKTDYTRGAQRTVAASAAVSNTRRAPNTAMGVQPSPVGRQAMM
ncbi:MAG TPA: hypothetical protein VGF89_13320 [Steroidobacteraceae bacterium]|jgi:hypothetical protein